MNKRNYTRQNTVVFRQSLNHQVSLILLLGFDGDFRSVTVPLSSRGLLARLIVWSPELGLWERALASFCAKSLQEKKKIKRVYYLSHHTRFQEYNMQWLLQGYENRNENREDLYSITVVFSFAHALCDLASVCDALAHRPAYKEQDDTMCIHSKNQFQRNGFSLCGACVIKIDMVSSSCICPFCIMHHTREHKLKCYLQSCSNLDLLTECHNFCNCDYFCFPFWIFFGSLLTWFVLTQVQVFNYTGRWTQRNTFLFQEIQAYSSFWHYCALLKYLLFN